MLEVKARPFQKKTKEMRQKYQIVLGSEIGQEVYKDILNDYYFQNIYERGDTHHTAFQAGQANVAWNLIRIMENPVDIDNPSKDETEEKK